MVMQTSVELVLCTLISPMCFLRVVFILTLFLFIYINGLDLLSYLFAYE